MPGVQGLIAELAYLQRSCMYLIDALRDVERTAGSLDDLDPMREAMIEAVTGQEASFIKHHLDSAARSAEDWRARIEAAAG